MHLYVQQPDAKQLLWRESQYCWKHLSAASAEVSALQAHSAQLCFKIQVIKPTIGSFRLL